MGYEGLNHTVAISGNILLCASLGHSEAPVMQVWKEWSLEHRKPGSCAFQWNWALGWEQAAESMHTSPSSCAFHCFYQKIQPEACGTPWSWHRLFFANGPQWCPFSVAFSHADPPLAYPNWGQVVRIQAAFSGLLLSRS